MKLPEVSGFLGAFAALVALAECAPVRNKALRYAASFVVGILVCYLLTWAWSFLVRL